MGHFLRSLSVMLCVLGLAASAQAITTRGTVGDGVVSLVYDPDNGSVSLDAPAGMRLNGVSIWSEGNLLLPGVANWNSENMTVISDTPAQVLYLTMTFLGSTFLASDGYVVGPILPAGLTEAHLLSDLRILYVIEGRSGALPADLVVVPEPITMVAALMGLASLGGYLRRRR